MPSKVVSMRVPDPLYTQLEEHSKVLGVTIAATVLKIVEDVYADSTGKLTMTTPMVSLTSGGPGTESRVDVFFSVKVSEGAPKACPRCTEPSPTYSFGRKDGGTWSCPRCRAHGRWYHNQPIEILSTGAPREAWTKAK